jgi:hypothetical protein
MGKATYKGLVPKDDPMFSSGPELWSHPGYDKYSTSTPTSTDGETPEGSSQNYRPDETEEDNTRLGALRLRKMQHQSESFRIQSRAVSQGKPNSNSTSGENEPK